MRHSEPSRPRALTTAALVQVPGFGGRGGIGLGIVALTTLAYLPATVGAWEPALGWVAGAVVSALIAAWRSTRSLEQIALALLPASVLVNTSLVPPGMQYVPPAVLGGALLLRFVARLRGSSIVVRMPNRWVLASAGTYLLWAIVASFFSNDRLGSGAQALAAGVVLLISLVVVPSVIRDIDGVHRVLAVMAAIGLVLAASSIVLAVTGPFELFGRWVGFYFVTEAMLGGEPLGVVVLRASGPFATPGYQGIAIAVAIVATLVLARRRRPGLGAVLLVLIFGLIVTLTRSALLAGAAGAAFIAVVSFVRRAPDARALATAVVIVAFLGAMGFEVLEFRARYDIAFDRYGPLAADLDGFPIPPNGTAGSGSGVVRPPPPGPGSTSVVRGGWETSGRLAIWRASLEAIAASPLVGHGFGENPSAIAPYLTGSNSVYAGLTSHNTLLRTAVELGIPGLLALMAFIVAVLVSAVSGRPQTSSVVVVFLTLLGVMGFESLLLGGASYPSLALGVTAGLLSAPLVARD